jgi:hypothetical protein
MLLPIKVWTFTVFLASDLGDGTGTGTGTGIERKCLRERHGPWKPTRICLGHQLEQAVRRHHAGAQDGR